MISSAGQLLRLRADLGLEGLGLRAPKQEGGVEQDALADFAGRRRPAPRVVGLDGEKLEQPVGAIARVLDHLSREVVLLLLAEQERRARRARRDGLRLVPRAPERRRLVQ